VHVLYWPQWNSRKSLVKKEIKLPKRGEIYVSTGAQDCSNE